MRVASRPLLAVRRNNERSPQRFGLAGFLGMELCPLVRLVRSYGGEPAPVVAGRNRVSAHCRTVRADEVGVIAVCDPVCKRIITFGRKSIPANGRSKPWRQRV
jgi:hypothetical protein